MCGCVAWLHCCIPLYRSFRSAVYDILVTYILLNELRICVLEWFLQYTALKRREWRVFTEFSPDNTLHSQPRFNLSAKKISCCEWLCLNISWLYNTLNTVISIHVVIVALILAKRLFSDHLVNVFNKIKKTNTAEYNKIKIVYCIHCKINL